MLRRAKPSWFLLPCLWASLSLGSGCEVVADFDPDKLNTDRTIGPVPLPSLDGSLLPNIPDASVSSDALIPAPVSDAGGSPDDLGGLDSAVADDAARQPDGRLPASDGGDNSEADAAPPGDISFEDAAIE